MITAISSEGVEHDRIDWGRGRRLASRVSRRMRSSEGEVAERVDGRIGILRARKRAWRSGSDGVGPSLRARRFPEEVERALMGSKTCENRRVDSSKQQKPSSVGKGFPVSSVCYLTAGHRILCMPGTSLSSCTAKFSILPSPLGPRGSVLDPPKAPAARSSTKTSRQSA